MDIKSLLKANFINIIITVLIFLFLPIFTVSSFTDAGIVSGKYSVFGLILEGLKFSRQFNPGFTIWHVILFLIAIYVVIAIITNSIIIKLKK